MSYPDNIELKNEKIKLYVFLTSYPFYRMLLQCHSEVPPATSRAGVRTVMWDLFPFNREIELIVMLFSV